MIIVGFLYSKVTWIQKAKYIYKFPLSICDKSKLAKNYSMNLRELIESKKGEKNEYNTKRYENTIEISTR